MLGLKPQCNTHQWRHSYIRDNIQEVQGLSVGVSKVNESVLLNVSYYTRFDKGHGGQKTLLSAFRIFIDSLLRRDSKCGTRI
jgi:hypothetical protein